jgi:hypothetical protein
MANFVDAIWRLQEAGVADVLLPFILVFTVVFAVLQKSKVLGNDSKKYNVMVAMVMGLGVVFPHVLGKYPPTSDPVEIINNSLPHVSVVVIAILMVMLLLGVFGAQFNLGKGINTWIMWLCLIVVVYIFGTAAGFFGNGNFPPFLWFLEDPNTQALLVMILAFGLIIWFITKEDDHHDKDHHKETMKDWIKAIGDSKDDKH